MAVTRLTIGSTVRVKNVQKFDPKALFVVLSLPGRNVKDSEDDPMVDV